MSHWISVVVAEVPVHSTPPMMIVLLETSAMKPVPVIVSTVPSVEEPVGTGQRQSYLYEYYKGLSLFHDVGMCKG